jgi:hypothetical protein
VAALTDSPGGRRLNVRRSWTEILQRITPVFDVGRFLDQRGGDLRISRCLRKLQKRCNLTHNILTAYQCISPLSYAVTPPT